ncbi:MAG: uroporphyrinogen-III synthase [Bdellovibrionota bacterium]
MIGDWFFINTRPVVPQDILEPKEGAPSLSGLLRAKGAAVYDLPLLALEPTKDLEELPGVLAELGQGDWVVFTSANGVRFTASFCKQPGNRELLDALSSGAFNLAAVGRKTADAVKHAFRDPHFVAGEATSRGLGEELSDLLQRVVRKPKIALLRGALASDELPTILRDASAELHALSIYRPVRREPSFAELDSLRKEGDGRNWMLLFTSSEAVRAWASVASAIVPHESVIPAAAVLGPETARTAEEQQFPIAFVATHPTVQSLGEDALRYAETHRAFSSC